MGFGDKIRSLRNELGWTQEYVAGKLKISIPALSRYESGMYEPKSLGIINDFAKLYNVSTDFLLGLDLDYSEYDIKKVFPILGIVKAGYNYLVQENHIGYVHMHKYVSDPENYFALKVTGDSMQPIMHEEDIIIVRMQNDVESGQVAIILIEEEEATVKKIVKHDDYIELVAFNPYYPAKKLNKNDNFQIIGKVVEARITKIFE